MTIVSPSGRAEKGDTGKAAGIKIEEKLVMMWVDGAERVEDKDHFGNDGLIEGNAMGDTATTAREDANADIGLADNKGQEHAGGSGSESRARERPRRETASRPLTLPNTMSLMKTSLLESMTTFWRTMTSPADLTQPNGRTPTLSINPGPAILRSTTRSEAN